MLLGKISQRVGVIYEMHKTARPAVVAAVSAASDRAENFLVVRNRRS